MAILQRIRDGSFLSPGPRLAIGRGSAADWRLDSSTVSQEHAIIYWRAEHWYVRDLASTNGTWVNGQREGAIRRLHAGDEVAFGSADAVLRVIDTREPCPSAVSSSGERLFGQRRGLWLPNILEPSASVLADGEGWIFESETEQHRVRHGDRILVEGASYRLELPPAAFEELPTTHAIGESTEGLKLRFTVSSDEEHVALEVIHRATVIELGARAHNYPLLLLARAREAESLSLSPEQAGWVDSEQLMSWLKVERVRLNLLLWRAKQCFKQACLPVEHLIERRPDTRQLRLGLADFEVRGT